MQKLFFFLLGMLVAIAVQAATLPEGFVYLKDIDPTIVQDMRYATSHNFIGHPIKNYLAAQCILARPAAQALAKVQQELLRSNLSLQVYDCYRPQSAVDEFIAWSAQPEQQQMKAEFYPRVDKADFFKLGYVAAKSGHTRGSTVDLTIVSLPHKTQPVTSHITLVACDEPYLKRFRDGSVDMGTGFDCMDELSHNDNTAIGIVSYSNRMLLKNLMEKYSFVPYQGEWWHFTLKDEPYPDTYFNFPVR